VDREEESGGCSRAAAEEACTRGRAAAAEEEAGSSGVDDGGEDRRSRERSGNLESFGMKSEMTRDRLLIICLNLSTTVHKREPLLIVLKLISSDSGFKPIMMKVLSETVLETLMIS
jgi:hypothetical protein